MTDFLKTLLVLSASGSLLGLGLVLAWRVTGRRLPSTLWYYAWLPVLLRLVLPLPGLIPGPQPAAEPAAAPVTAAVETMTGRTYRYDGPGDHAPFGGGDGAEEAPAAEAAPPVVLTGEEGPAAPALPRLQLGTILKSPRLWLGLWLAGAVLCFGRYTAGYIRFRRLLMKTLETTDGSTARVFRELTPAYRPRLFCSAYVMTPMLLGLCRPLIVLPRGPLAPETARNVLRHELTHYRRGDLFVKWFFVLTASLHWFNPLMLLFRRELDRVCELSCDETVLARMEPSQRRSYGETLLDLAANRTLPAGVVATTFATEKRALKERLEQIMKFRYAPRAILALTIAALVLMGALALAAAPARASAASADSPEPAPEASASMPGFSELDTVPVSTVDELLAAIRPGVCAVLAPGTYDLSTASDYGEDTDSEYYRWEAVHDGYELVIENVTHLAITADDPAATVLSAVPRYADVLAISDCLDIRLSGFTAGHTVEAAQCMGGVVHLMGTEAVSIEGCAFYGCGVLGVEAENCRNVNVSDSDIYECSNGAVWLTSCRNVRFDRCDFRDCRSRYDGTGMINPALDVFSVESCYGVAVIDSHVYGNFAMELVRVSYSQEVYLLGTLFENNTVQYDEILSYSGAVFNVEGDPVTVAGCEFRDEFPIYTDGEAAVAADMDGNALSYDALAAMKQGSVAFPGFAELETPELQRTLGEDGLYEVHVSTVDEFLAAIAPNTTIYLDEGLYDLPEASHYGAYGSPYYYWVDLFDGPGLVITGVENLSIVGAGKDVARIETLPRYAEVLRFDDCKNVAVLGVTAGHTQGAGTCTGAVLEFRHCEGVTVGDCGLFGCGTFGVVALDCGDIAVKGNEIYECSGGAVQLSRCVGGVFSDNDIHDCAYPTYGVYDSLDVTIDGEAVAEETMEDFIAQAFAEEYEMADSLFLGQIAAAGRSTGDTSIDIPGAGPYKSGASNG